MEKEVLDRFRIGIHNCLDAKLLFQFPKLEVWQWKTVQKILDGERRSWK